TAACRATSSRRWSSTGRSKARRPGSSASGAASNAAGRSRKRRRTTRRIAPALEDATKKNPAEAGFFVSVCVFAEAQAAEAAFFACLACLALACLVFLTGVFMSDAGAVLVAAGAVAGAAAGAEVWAKAPNEKTAATR